MRKIIIIAAAMAASACAHVASTEQTAAVRENAERATAEARSIANEMDPERKAANCSNFITISRNLRSRVDGYDDAAAERAWSRYNAYLVQRLGSQDSATQLVASSANFLLGADPVAREAAARHCIEHASTIGR